MKINAMLAVSMLLAASCGSSDSDGAVEADAATDSATETVTTEAVEEAEPADEADSTEAEAEEPMAAEPVTITLVTHESFVVSEGILETFTNETGITVEVVSAGDAGEVVARSVLSSGQPEGDVLFGVDNTFLQRALDADVFEAYQSPALESVPDELEIDPQYRVTPIDYGDVCVNYVIGDGPAPTSLDDLANPAFASQFVTMNPETSSPGFAFLVATVAAFGEEGWRDYWAKLAEGGVTVTSGWSDAYYGEFVQGGGDKTVVLSYATSPVAEVFYADPAIDSSPTGVMTDGCFRQIEFAGVLKGTEHQAESEALIDFMLGDVFQADIPLNMFVFPANADVELPEVFTAHAVHVENPMILDPEIIENFRSEWTEDWTEIVLR